jgi:hypothetical protein
VTKKGSEGTTLSAGDEEVTAKVALALTDQKLFLGMLYESWQKCVTSQGICFERNVV